MTPSLHVGCAMWTHRAWPGVAVPGSTNRRDELAAYATVLNAVEGNTTFYAVPRADVVEHWARSVPDGFRFMFKLPKTITHDRKLRDCSAEVSAFLDAMTPCHHLMEPIAIQLPASFGPASLSALDDFLRTVPRAFRWAVEVRHPALFDSQDHVRRLNDMLFSHGADRITLDSRAVFAGPRVTPAEHEAFENKPRLPVVAVATNDRPVVRFIGQTDPEANPPFWEPWIDTVVRWIADGRRPLVFIHTPDNIAAPGLCRQFHSAVRSRCPELEALADLAPVDTPSLFD